MLSDPDLINELAQLAVAVMSLAVTVASIFVSRWAGVKIEEKHMKALHEAAMTWAENAVRRGVTDASNQALTDFTTYARASVPDALAALKPGSDVLFAILRRYLSR